MRQNQETFKSTNLKTLCLQKFQEISWKWNAIVQIFKHTAGEGGLELDPQQEWMSESTRCMHVRLLYDHFQETIKKIPEVEEAEEEEEERHLCHLRQQLRESLYITANSDVAIVSHTNCLVLHITMRAGDLGFFVKIHPVSHDTTSTCKCTRNFIRNRPRYWHLKNFEEIACTHIQAAVKPMQVLKKFLTKKKGATSRPKNIEKFCKKEGKWISASLLTHKPKQPGDPIYHRYL